MIINRFGDIDKLVLDYLSANSTGLILGRKLSSEKAKPNVVVGTQPVGSETAITMNFMVILETWAWKSNNESDIVTAKETMEYVLTLLQEMPSQIGRVIKTESVMPSSAAMDETGFEFIEGSAIITLARK